MVYMYVIISYMYINLTTHLCILNNILRKLYPIMLHINATD